MQEPKAKNCTKCGKKTVPQLVSGPSPLTGVWRTRLCDYCHHCSHISQARNILCHDDKTSVVPVPDAAAKLQALMEGLEMRNIDELLYEGQEVDFRRVGELIAERTKKLAN